MHQNEEVLIKVLMHHGFRKVELCDARPGDVFAFKYGRVASHVGLCIGDGEFVHSFYMLGRVVRQPLAGDLKNRLVGVYRSPWMD